MSVFDFQDAKLQKVERKAKCIWAFPNENNFGKAKVTKKECIMVVWKLFFIEK